MVAAVCCAQALGLARMHSCVEVSALHHIIPYPTRTSRHQPPASAWFAAPIVCILVRPLFMFALTRCHGTGDCRPEVVQCTMTRVSRSAAPSGMIKRGSADSPRAQIFIYLSLFLAHSPVLLGSPPFFSLVLLFRLSHLGTVCHEQRLDRRTQTTLTMQQTRAANDAVRLTWRAEGITPAHSAGNRLRNTHVYEHAPRFACTDKVVLLPLDIRTFTFGMFGN